MSKCDRSRIALPLSYRVDRIAGQPLREVLARLKSMNASEHLATLVREAGALAEEEQSQIVGDALPKGLRLAT